METINNLASAAVKAVWGEDESHQEPVSGKTGDVSKGEPYDAGNMEREEVDSKNKSTATHGNASGHGNSNVQTTIAEKTLSQASLAEPSPIVDSMSKLHIDDKKPKVEATTFNTDEHTDGSTAAKKAPGVPAPTDSSKAQIDVRDPEDPLAHPGKAEQRQNVDDKAGLDVDADPVKIEGPGPKPLEQVAKEHGGDAGAIDSKPVGTAPEPQQESGGTHDDETGKLHVRASGFSADGGDFDASKPGAAAEADRLKEVKEQSPENHESHAKSTGSGLHGLHLPHHKQEDESATKEKVSLKEKIKAKLHKS